MKIIICNSTLEMAEKVQSLILNIIKDNKQPVLGLATGSTPLLTYELLVKDYEDNKTSWKNVITFNLDEYYGLEKNHEQSYRYYMNKNLFKHINIKLENTNIPYGVGDSDLIAKRYEDLIVALGPIDLQLLGLGTNGHIGFNEPGTNFDSLTHVVQLKNQTRNDNARFFNNDPDKVPTEAITMGIKTILNCKKIVLLASGNAKAEAVYNLINSKPSTDWPCTALQKHKDITIILDQEAASLLKSN